MAVLTFAVKLEFVRRMHVAQPKNRFWNESTSIQSESQVSVRFLDISVQCVTFQTERAQRGGPHVTPIEEQEEVLVPSAMRILVYNL